MEGKKATCIATIKPSLSLLPSETATEASVFLEFIYRELPPLEPPLELLPFSSAVLPYYNRFEFCMLHVAFKLL
ncbi:uncharacterized protein DS421_10g291800 [Arachis hypogaea]|nr:uncharacterized protein DS421_10g291800 [Arachis hypogaea]